MKLNLTFIIIIGIILLNQYVLPRLFNISPLLSVLKNTISIIYIGISATIILLLSGLLTSIINLNSHLRFSSICPGNILLILIPAFLGYTAILLTKNFLPSVYKSFNPFLLMLLISCSELSLIIVILSGFTVETSLADKFIRGIAASSAYTVLIFLLKGIFERLEFAEVNSKLKEISIPVIAACLLALACFGFSGIII